MKRQLKLIGMLFGLLWAQVSWADWVLQPDASSVAFLSTKNARVTETHGFDKIAGHIAADGAATLTIDLASVETQIPIRNERMRDMFFEVAKFPEANVTLQLDAAALQQLGAGTLRHWPVKAKLSLHGVTQSINTELLVVGLAQGGVFVTTSLPILLTVDDYGLKAGLSALQTVAKLDSITPVVPVMLSLVFEKKN